MECQWNVGISSGSRSWKNVPYSFIIFCSHAFEEDPPRDYTFSESCHTCRSPQPSSHSYSTSISLPHLPHPAISLRIFDGFFKFQPCRTGSYDQDHREEAGLTRIAFHFCATWATNRCKTFSRCTQTLWKNASTRVVTILPPKPWHPKRYVPSSCCPYVARGWEFPKEACVMHCTEKFIKHSERVGARFSEMNAGAWLIIRCGPVRKTLCRCPERTKPIMIRHKSTYIRNTPGA